MVMQLAAAALVSSVACGGSGGGSGRPVSCSIPAATGVARAPLPPPRVAPCDAQGWCWESPLPFRDSLTAIRHRTDQTIIASSRGNVLRLRGDAWEALPALPRPAYCTGAINVHDVWAAGDKYTHAPGAIDIRGIVWAYDGSAWTMHDFGGDSPIFNPFHIWGTREREVMAVGAGGGRLLSGGRWNDAQPPQSLGQGLWGCDDSYFAGLYGGGGVGMACRP